MALVKQSRSKKAFISAFLELSKEIPLEKITVVNLVDRSGYSRGSFYAQFSSIDEFLKIVVEDEIQNYIEVSRELFSKEVEIGFPIPSIVSLFDYVYSRKELYRFMFTNYDHFNAVKYFFSGTAGPLDQFEISFVDDYQDMDIEFYRFLSSYVQKGAIMFWISQDFKWSPKHLAEQVSLFYYKRVGNVGLVKKNKK